MDYPGWSKWLVLGGGIALAAFVLDRALLAMEQRGWIYYRKIKGRPGTVGNAFLEIHSIFQPSQKQVLEARREEPKIERKEADPDVPGAGAVHPRTEVNPGEEEGEDVE